MRHTTGYCLRSLLGNRTKAGEAHLHTRTKAACAIAFFACLSAVLFFPDLARGQCALGADSQSPQETQIQQLFHQKSWQRVVQLAAPLTQRTPDENYEYGLALAHLQRWNDARSALIAGERACPRQERFPVELAGVSFEMKRYPETAAWLRKALKLDPRDAYANDFAGTVYLLMGNTGAALKFWNRVQKPYIAAVDFDPHIQLHRSILDRAFAFSPQAVLKWGDLKTTQARLDALGIFPAYNIVLNARPDNKFDVAYHAIERDGFGSSRLQSLVSIFSGAAYETVYPDYYNIGRSSMNVESLFRWDSQKLRAFMSVSAPLSDRPEWRWAISADVRDENWAIRRSFTGAAPVLGSLDLERQSLRASFDNVHSGTVQWSLGADVSHRAYHQVLQGTALNPALVLPGYELKALASLQDKLIDLPERRFTLSTAAGAELARMWPMPKAPAPAAPHVFGKLQGSAFARWFPQAQGDAYELQQRVRAARTLTNSAGSVPFDELYLLGMERDTDLWLRGQIGTRDRKKGSSPLASSYFLANTDFYRRVYGNGLISIKAGPLLDVARAAAPTSGLANSQWLIDAGVDAKITVLGTSIVLTYGRDLRAGTNAFYATAAHE